MSYDTWQVDSWHLTVVWVTDSDTEAEPQA